MTPVRIPFRGVEVAAHVCASGPPVVLLHNAGNDHHNWDPQIVSLEATHRVVAIDLCGFGDSPAPDEALSLDLYGEQVRAVVDALDLERASLVGHCVGGAAAWRFALHHADRVDRLALFSPATLATMRAGPYGALYWLARTSGLGDRVATQLADTVLQWGPTRRAAIRRQFGRGGAPPDFERHCEALYLRPGTLVALRRVLLAFDSFGFLDRAAAPPGVPTLLAWGSDNRILPYRASHDVRERLVPTVDHVFEGAGHLVMRERPDAVTALLRRWLVGDVTEPRRASV